MVRVLRLSILEVSPMFALRVYVGAMTVAITAAVGSIGYFVFCLSRAGVN